MRRYAFEGIHILDFTWYGVGPVTTKYLADNGAEVIRIESAARLDGLRMAPPWKDAKPGVNNSQFFASYNTSKKGITLDMRKPCVQGDIFASPRLAEGHHRQFDNALLEDSKAIIVAGVVDCNYLPPARGWLQSLQSVEHARQGMRAVQGCKEDSYSRHDRTVSL